MQVRSESEPGLRSEGYARIPCLTHETTGCPLEGSVCTIPSWCCSVFREALGDCSQVVRWVTQECVKGWPIILSRPAHHICALNAVCHGSSTSCWRASCAAGSLATRSLAEGLIENTFLQCVATYEAVGVTISRLS